MKDQPHVLALDRAVQQCGGVSKLAALLKVNQSAVSNWRARGTVIDAVHCSEIERLTDGTVSRQALRPGDWHLIWPELVEAKAA